MKNNIVSISNKVVNSCYDLSMVEMRLVFQFISLIDNSAKERDKPIDANMYYRTSVQDYSDLYSIPLKVAKVEVISAITSLFDKVFTYKDEKGKTVKTRWVSSIRYEKELHEVDLAWAVGILPHIANLQANFTSYRLKHIAELPSAYSFRWYTLFLMELNRNSRNMKGEGKILEVEYKVEDIRNMFMLGDKYTIISDLRKRVIERPIEAMMETKQCNIGVKETEYVRTGKCITSIKFYISFTISPEQERFTRQAEVLKKRRVLKFGTAHEPIME